MKTIRVLDQHEQRMNWQYQELWHMSNSNSCSQEMEAEVQGDPPGLHTES